MTGERVALTLAVLAFGTACALLMLRGWRSRQRRQADLPPPEPAPPVPGELLAPPVAGLFVGTTSATDWLDRVAVHGLSARATGWLSVHAGGVRIERDGGGDLWLPLARLRSASVGDALAGKVVGRGGLLLLDWELGGHLLTSGFRAGDAADNRRLAAAITAAISAAITAAIAGRTDAAVDPAAERAVPSTPPAPAEPAQEER